MEIGSRNGFFGCGVGHWDWFGGSFGLVVERKRPFHRSRNFLHIQTLSILPNIATFHDRADYLRFFPLRNVPHRQQFPGAEVVFRGIPWGRG